MTGPRFEFQFDVEQYRRNTSPATLARVRENAIEAYRAGKRHCPFEDATGVDYPGRSALAAAWHEGFLAAQQSKGR